MDEQRIQASLKKLLAVFIIICLLLGGLGQYLFRSVSNLYLVSVQGRMEERALQYKKSFQFKMNSDLLMLRVMAHMVEDTIAESGSTEAAGSRLLYLWDASKTAEFGRLCYFMPNGEGMQLSSQRDVVELQTINEPIEMQTVIQKALKGKSVSSNAFYDSYLGYNVVSYATPIYYNSDIKGVLVCSINADSYEDILTSVSSVSNIGAVAVIDSDGKVLASTRTHQSQGFYNLNGSKYLTNGLYSKFMQALSANETRFFEFSFEDLPLYAFIMPMGISEYKIMIVDTDKGVSDAVSDVVNYAHLIAVLFAATSILFVMAVLYMNRRYNKQLLQVAYHDRLTGAYNRYKFFQLLDQRRKKNTEYTVAAINIRKFKYINELFSSVRSDRLLKDICAVLNRCIKSEEFFCRDTADTFLICLNTSDRDMANERLNAILEQLKDSNKSIHHTYPITFYGGCATLDDCVDKNSNEELMSHVMLALSYAKQSQQATVTFYDTKAHDRETLNNYIENRMEWALEHGEFQMFLQPKMDLRKNTIIGAEALVRWIIEGTNNISPNYFIPLFEQNGFCTKLDLYMVEQACKQIRKWIDAGISPIPISVNQTKLLLYEDDYVERICSITKKYDVPNKYITLEILEGLALENLEKVSVCIEKLHDQGFSISMDDFGTGYASLTTLSQLQIDELKLDRSFLMQADQNTERNRRKILEVVVEVAKRLNITTVAEGIETESHSQLMRDMHCDYGQGYFYSRPIPANEFTKKFLQHNVQ